MLSAKLSAILFRLQCVKAVVHTNTESTYYMHTITLITPSFAPEETQIASPYATSWILHWNHWPLVKQILKCFQTRFTIDGKHINIDMHWDVFWNISLMIGLHCIRQWLGAIWHQAITWCNIDLDLRHHMVSLSHNGLTWYKFNASWGAECTNWQMYQWKPWKCHLRANPP